MSTSAVAGPLVTFGQSTYAAIEYNGEAGPSLFFNGSGILDPRQPFTYTPGQDMGQPICGFLGVDNVNTLNVAPWTLSSAALAAAQTATNGTAFTLVSSNSLAGSGTGIAVSQTIVRADTGVAVTGLLAIDGGTTVSGYISNGTSGTAGNVLIVSTASYAPLAIGMVLSGTGIAAGTVITGYGPSVNVTNGASGAGFTGSYTVSGAPVAAGTSGSPITITATLSNVAVTGSNGVANVRVPFGQVGSVQLWNPTALTARAVSVTGSSSATGGNVLVSGYDIYGYPMTETIAAPTSATTVNGKKAFKYIASVTPQFTDGSHNYSVGTTDIYGFPIRTDSFADVVINYSASLNPVQITSATGYTAAVNTVATSTTGDVRGTYALQTAASTGANRLFVRQSPPVYNISTAAGLFGVTQA
jgi:hypothetical protein